MPIASISQDTVHVDVAFYDETQRENLLRYSTSERMQRLVEAPVEVPTAEFLAYYLFHRKRLGTPGYRSYSSIGEKLDTAVAHMDGCVDWNGQSICTAAGVQRQLTEISEHIGEAIGLSIISRIHGLTEADWSPIEPQRGRGAAPSFDFELASDGNQFIQVENKGSSVIDNREIDDVVKAQEKRIAEKKEKLSELSRHGRDPYPASVRYGTIAALDGRRDGNVRCWLTDPPTEQIEDSPSRFRLVQRMRFLRDWISLISPRSPLAAALATRIADMENMRDPFELDRVPLRKSGSESFEFGNPSGASAHSTFFASKSVVIDEPAGGIVLQLSRRDMFLVGIQEQLIDLAVAQNFAEITAYKAKTFPTRTFVECVISKGRFARLDLPESLRTRARESNGYRSFSLSGQIHYSPAGLVFGILPLPWD